MIDSIVKNYLNLIIQAIWASAMNRSSEWDELTTKIIDLSGCELWELIEAMDIVRNSGGKYPQQQSSFAEKEVKEKSNCGISAHKYNYIEPFGGLSGDHADNF